MSPTIQLQLLLITFAGWVGRQQTSVIQCLVEENRVLKEQIEASGRRMCLTDEQRRRLIAAKWTHPRKKVGRPGVMKEIRRLIIEMAEENPS